MSVLKALSTHLSSTQQTAFHLEVGCKSNYTHRPHKARILEELTQGQCVSPSLSSREKFNEDCKSEKVWPLLCVHMQRDVCLCCNRGQDRRKRLDSGGVGIAEVSSPVLPVGMELISPSVHSVSSSLFPAWHTQELTTQSKHLTICTGYTIARINHMHISACSAYTWLTHTSVAAARKTDPAICSAQSFPELSKPEPALNSQGWTADRQAHTHTVSDTRNPNGINAIYN